MKKKAKHAEAAKKNVSSKKKATSKVMIHPATKKNRPVVDRPVLGRAVSHVAGHKKTGAAASETRKSIFRAAWAGIISLLLSLLIAYMGARQVTTKGQLISYILLIVVAIIFSIVYMFGYAKLGKIAKASVLRTASYMFIALTIIDVAYLLILTAIKRPENPYASAVFLFIYGAIAIIFGRGVWELKDKLGLLAKATGSLNIASGILVLTVIFAPIGILLALFVELFNIATIFKAAKVYV